MQVKTKMIRIFTVFYHILLIKISYSRKIPANPTIYIFRVSWLIYSNPKYNLATWIYRTMDSFVDGMINI
jgi:hypothetical protein